MSILTLQLFCDRTEGLGSRINPDRQSPIANSDYGFAVAHYTILKKANQTTIHIHIHIQEFRSLLNHIYFLPRPQIGLPSSLPEQKKKDQKTQSHPKCLYLMNSTSQQHNVVLPKSTNLKIVPFPDCVQNTQVLCVHF